MKNNTLNKFNLLLGLIVLLLSAPPLISAEMETLGTVKQYDCITLPQICNNCTYNNITSIIYPNKSLALGQVAMTNSGTEYSYFSCNLTKVTGEYIVNGKGDLDGMTTVWNYNYFVTPTGTNPSSFLNNPILLILGLMGLALVIFGGIKGIPWFGFIGSIMFLLVGVYTMIFGFDNINNMYTQGSALVFIGMGVIFMILSGYEWMTDTEDEEDEDGGEDYDED